jgi:hypothetical protein
MMIEFEIFSSDQDFSSKIRMTLFSFFTRILLSYHNILIELHIACIAKCVTGEVEAFSSESDRRISL